jgi:predicted glycoside hydrolase/deacetylase ChbG (UPF0249 family)
LRRIIVTADDFGVAREINDAVERAHREGVLTAASLMVGAPEAADAVPRTKCLPSLRLGLHLLFLVQLAGSALNETVPGAPLYGEPAKVLLLRERSPVSVTTASLLSVKLGQALARVLFIIVGLLAASWSLKFERLPVRGV